MPKIWEGKLSGRGVRFAVVMSRFNSTVTDKLLEGAVAALRRCSVADEDVEIVRVPGAFEIPIAARKLAATGRFAAVVCLGAIIRGGTPHWHYLCHAVTEGIVRASLDADVPMTNGVLTTESLSQAVERAGKGTDNKGYDAAVAAVEMASLVRQLGE